MSQNTDTVNTYLDGFRKNDHEQILSCLTDDVEWTVFGAFHLTGKQAYDEATDGGPPSIAPPARTPQDPSRPDPVLLDRRRRVDCLRCFPSDRQTGLRRGHRRRTRIHRPS